MIAPGPEFLVLTGFLGSGKTTLLRDFLTRPEAADTAIIVNEVGEIGLDGALLREVGGDVAMTTLANGCICCQMGSDLTTTVEALLGTERPGDIPLARIVLETSGLSKPGPILRQLASLAQHRMRVSVLATYDPTRPPEIRDFEEAAAQWAGAHRIVVTKGDMVSPKRFAAASGEIGEINPLAEIVAEASREPAVSAAFAPPRPGPVTMPVPIAGKTRPHERLTSLLLRQEDVVAYDDLAAWLDNLAGFLGERLLRIKGLVRVRESEEPILVQSVGTLFSQPRLYRGGMPGDGGFLVVIARDAEAGEIGRVEPSLPFSLSRAPGRGGRSLRAEAV
ncbi:G3E family GTPase [Enterovirga rhinocerotis]|uniref:G3E family GTPase n=2 Tax=Enterovirga rhinocerotis TaxID=1339210 RepID=A0A4R7BXG6_9HYPH|nr:G3E family GTPase [Enterovirga rhinocerotis]